MVKKALKYLGDALGEPEWTRVTTMPEQQAIVLLDGVMSTTTLSSQSRSNYRNYLRRLYRLAAKADLDIGGGSETKVWSPAPNGTTARRAQVAYDRFVRWAVGRGVWPETLKPQHLLDWALAEKAGSNQHWRKDYDRLQVALAALAADGLLASITAPPLPARTNEKYGLPLDQWPTELRREWERMCTSASAPLRKGGMRPWRPITRNQYQTKLSQFLGWIARERTVVQIAGETWASLLSIDRCQDYLNWLVTRTGKDTLNPSHTAFLRMVRGFHRFLLDGSPATIDGFTDLCKRCEVEERDKAVRMAPFPVVARAFDQILAAATDAMAARKQTAESDRHVASLQVDAIIFGLLTTRALRRANVIGIRLEDNLVRTEAGYELRYTAKEMKGHRKFETVVPSELTTILDDYLHRGRKALTGHEWAAGDKLLVTNDGTAMTGSSFSSRVHRLTKKHVGKRLNPHMFRHIVATHGAQVWRMTPPELAAFLAHKSITTVMKYYEVTNPVRAAERFDAFRADSAA